MLVTCTRKPKGQEDRVSYSIGVQFGQSLRSQNLVLNADVLARGIRDGLAGDRSQLSEEEIRLAVGQMGEEQHKAIKVEADANLSKGRDYLLNNKAASGVKVTASGLQYKIAEPGQGAKVGAEDTVVLNYRGTLVDGTEFDSSYKRGTPAEFPVKGVIPGWGEGLQLLKKGAKATFFIPPELGYADHARPPIPNNAVLIFRVELIDVKPPARKH